MSGFDRDTAVEALEAGRWRAVVPERWFIVSGPNGGWIAAVLTRTMIEAVADPLRTPRSLSVHFLEAPAAGPVEIEATIERAGGTTSALSLRMTQDGRPIALALGVCSAWREGQPEWADARPPQVPPPDECLRIDPDRTPVPEFQRNYDARAANGRPGQGEPAPAIGWIRTAEPHPYDPVLLAALTDAWLPVAFVRTTERTIVPTIDLTIHFRAPTGRENRGTGPLGSDAHPWTLLVMRSGTSAGGVWEEDGELWSEDGVLLAQSRQLAIIRRPKR